MSNEKKIELANGQVPPIMFIDYLSSLTLSEFDELYSQTLVDFENSHKIIKELENMKGKYDVCASDEFFQVLWDSYKINFITAYTLNLLSPIGLKNSKFQLLQPVSYRLDKLIPAVDDDMHDYFIPVYGTTVAGFDYSHNLTDLLEFLDKNPLALGDFFLKNPEVYTDFKKLVENDVKTLEPDDEREITDLALFLHYKKGSHIFSERYKRIKSMDFMDFRDEALCYFINEDGSMESHEYPYDTCCLPEIPDEKMKQLESADKQSNEALLSVLRNAQKAKTEFDNYALLIEEKYGLKRISRR